MIQGVKFPEKMANLSVTDCEAIDRHYQQDTMQAGDGGSVMVGGGHLEQVGSTGHLSMSLASNHNVALFVNRLPPHGLHIPQQ